jgi:hypothetical protein
LRSENCVQEIVSTNSFILSHVKTDFHQLQAAGIVHDAGANSSKLGAAHSSPNLTSSVLSHLSSQKLQLVPEPRVLLTQPPVLLLRGVAPPI